MSFDAHKNFAYSTVATAPSPASSGTSLIVASGDGSKFPAVPFNATVWPAGSQPTTSNAEIVRVTNRSTDTLTLTRAQESTSARAISVGDQIAATVTAKVVTDIENQIGSLNTVATSGAAQTVDYATANTWDITLTAACTITLSSVTSGFPTTLNLILRQDGTGSRTVTWPASVTWLDSAAPVLQTAPSSVDVVSLTSVDGGTNWYGFAASDLSLNWKTAIPGTCTYGSSTTFTCSGDQTAIFKKGLKLRVLQTTFKYFVITGSSYNGTTTTTVTITGGTDYSLANASLDQVLISGLDSPDGWPGWFNFNAALTGTSATTAIVTRFNVVGNTVNLELNFSATSNATTKTFTLPITPANIANMQWVFPTLVKDNGTRPTTPGLILINPNNASVSLYKDFNLAAWTASGTWLAIGSCTYEF